MTGALLTVTGLRVDLPRRRSRSDAAPATSLVHDVNLAIGKGELVCLVGESGSGKTVTGQAILGLARESGLDIAGQVELAGIDLVTRTANQVRALRGRDLALVPQEPSSALDPLATIGSQMAEAVVRRDGRGRGTRQRILDLLSEAHVPEPEQRLGQYPHELSGGLCQRVLIAMALAGRPQLIIADEPTSALDATVQLHLLDLLDRVRQESATSILLITHDMGVAARADRIVVMYAGTIVEQGPAAKVLARPRHPYTAGLIASVPRIRDTALEQAGERHRLATIPGSVPSPADRPGGCSFRTRCPLASGRCEARPPLEPLGDDAAVLGDVTRDVACWHTDITGALSQEDTDPAVLWSRLQNEGVR